MAHQRDIDDLVVKMTEEREKLLAQIEGLSEEAAAVAPAEAEGEAQWSAKEQCAHLAEMEAGYRAWVKRAIAEDNPDVSRVRGDSVAIPLEQANGRSLADLASQLRDERTKTLGMIKSMQPEDFDRPATQRMFGTLTALQWLRSYYRHDRMHQAQIAGRQSNYQPRYAAGREPDQRRTRIQ